MIILTKIFFFFFFNDTATTEIYTLSLHDALPISLIGVLGCQSFIHIHAQARNITGMHHTVRKTVGMRKDAVRSEEHTSELQSRLHLVCRLLLEKKKKQEQIDSRTSPLT